MEKRYITYEDFVERCNQGYTYEGYVIGFGYAFTRSMCNLEHVQKDIVRYDLGLKKDLLFSNVYTYQYIDTSEPRKKESYPPKDENVLRNNMTKSVLAEKDGYKLDWKVPTGAVASIGGEVYFSKKYNTWLGKNFKLYKQSFNGNKYTGGKNKFAKKTSLKFKLAGGFLGAWSAVSTFKSWYDDDITTGQLILEEASNAFSTFGGEYGVAWAFGWELGRYITTTETYQTFKFNFFYDYWEKKFGKPNEYNEDAWIYFFENYRP